MSEPSRKGCEEGEVGVVGWGELMHRTHCIKPKHCSKQDASAVHSCSSIVYERRT